MSFLSKLFGSKSDADKPQAPQKKEKKVAPPVWEQTIEDDDEDDYPSYEELVAQAEAGDVDAMVSVGMAHIEGEGAPIDLKKGMVYIEKAANCGSIEAAGLLYEWARDHINGLGKDVEEVVKFRELGARAGDVVAQFQLGQCYAQESDQWSTYQQDKLMAHFWFAQAYAQGNMFSAFGYAAGLMQGYSHVGPAPKDENNLIILPEKDHLQTMVQTDPQIVERLRSNAWEIVNALAGEEGGVGVIVKKLLAGINEEEADYAEVYKSIMESMQKVH